MRVLLDTNVHIAALIARGVCSSLLEHCVQRHTVVASDFILSELREHLVGKFEYSTEEAEEALTLLQSQVNMITPGPLESAVCRDPDDDRVLAAALAGHAQCIVTGDKDLLVIQEFQGIRILRPAEFVDYEAQSGP